MVMFGDAGDKGYELLVAENKFVDMLQVEIERAMARAGMSQSDLARRVGVSEARISQILGGNGSNLRARTIARIAHALNCVVHLEYCADETCVETNNVSLPQGRKKVALHREETVPFLWHEYGAQNDNWWALEERLVR